MEHAPPGEADAQRRRARGTRFGRLDVLRRRSRIKRVRGCGRARIPGAPGVEIRLADDGRASYGQVQMCGSVWSCPVCAARIREARATEVETAALKHLRAGGAVYFVTLTLPHHAGQPLYPLLDALAGGWRHLIKGRQYRDEAQTYGLLGSVRAVEVTYGRHGWHPHLHVLLFTARPLGRAAQDALSAAWFDRWAAHVCREGLGRCDPAAFRWQAVRGLSGGSALAAYLTKLQDGGSVGREMTRGDAKTGRRAARTPFQLLDSNDHADIAAWHEYENATAGRKVLTWSRKLRAALELLPELPDQDLADDAPGVTVAVLDDFHWRIVLHTRHGRAQLLDAAERDGPLGVARALRAWERKARRLAILRRTTVERLIGHHSDTFSA